LLFKIEVQKPIKAPEQMPKTNIFNRGAVVRFF